MTMADVVKRIGPRELILPRNFNLVGVRADGSRRTICSVSTRGIAEDVIRLAGPFRDYFSVEIVEAMQAPPGKQ